MRSVHQRLGYARFGHPGYEAKNFFDEILSDESCITVDENRTAFAYSN